MFKVVYESGGFTYWLRGTAWAMSRDRGADFPTREAAQAALDRGKQFMKPAARRVARIVTTEEAAALPDG